MTSGNKGRQKERQLLSRAGGIGGGKQLLECHGCGYAMSGIIQEVTGYCHGGIRTSQHWTLAACHQIEVPLFPVILKVKRTQGPAVIEALWHHRQSLDFHCWLAMKQPILHLYFQNLRSTTSIIILTLLAYRRPKLWQLSIGYLFSYVFLVRYFHAMYNQQHKKMCKPSMTEWKRLKDQLKQLKILTVQCYWQPQAAICRVVQSR